MAQTERDRLAEIVSGVVAADLLEMDHQLDTLAWIASGVDLYRYRKPDGPPRHLVAYFVLVDLAAARLLLVDHINAKKWLPTGGHVEPGEDPEETVRRELHEELGIAAEPVTGLSSNPLFVTQTTTVGVDAGHIDVSLWYVLRGAIAAPLVSDTSEFAHIRWWTFDEVAAAPQATLDPHLPRFVAKLRGDLAI